MPPSSPSHQEALDEAAALHQAGRFNDAEVKLRAILAGRPSDVGALQTLGAVLAAQGRHADAEQAFVAALAVDPDAADVLYNLGLLHQIAGRHDAAAECYRKVLALAGPSPELFINLARLSMGAGGLIEPAALLEQALALSPELIEPRQTLAQLYALRGDIDAAVAQREELIRRQPDRPELYRELILDLNFADGDDGSRVTAACRDWHRRFAGTPASPLYRDIDRDPDRRLRVGWVGGEQFRGHTLAAIALPLIEAHGDAIELTCYSDLPIEREDGITRRFQRRMRWRRTSGFSDERFAQAVADDHIDILIDPVGFTAGSRLLALARRPAPLQVSFPVMGTCGGPTVDYVLVDDGIAPDATLSHFSERALRVPFAYCYRPLSALPDIGEAPCERAGFVTFGSLNTLPKVSQRAIHAWRRILEQIEHSRLLVKAGFPFRDRLMQEHFLRRLADAGVDTSRVILKGWLPQQADHLALHNEVDIALDSFPYCGVTTTYEALVMGVPVVTLAGARVLGRYSAGILRAAGLAECVANDDDGYVARAVALAGDRSRLRSLRRSLRDALLNSLACDAPRIASSIEGALRSAWHLWCSQAPRG